MKILLTGATGFVGKELLQRLAKNEENTIYCLVRKTSLSKIDGVAHQFNNVELIPGDITDLNIIDSSDDFNFLTQDINCIIHAAAYYDLEGTYNPCFINNVCGTQNVLFFANKCLKLSYFHYISTIAVSGDFKGTFLEDGLDFKQSFSNSYAKTKFFAEYLVQKWEFEHQIKRRIYRLGVVIGDSETGQIPKWDGPYYFLRFLSKIKRLNLPFESLKYFPMPYSENSPFPLVPIDQVTSVLEESISLPKGEEECKTYHVVNYPCPTIGEFVHGALDSFDISIDILHLPESKFNVPLVKKIGLPEELLHYMYNECDYDMGNYSDDFSHLSFKSFSEYKKNFFQFAVLNIR